MTRVERLTAMQGGREAALAGEPVTACPYSTSGDGTQRALALAWVREWTRHQAEPLAGVSLAD